MVEVSTFQSMNGHDLLLHIFGVFQKMFFLCHGVEMVYTSPAYMLNILTCFYVYLYILTTKSPKRFLESKHRLKLFGGLLQAGRYFALLTQASVLGDSHSISAGASFHVLVLALWYKECPWGT